MTVPAIPFSFATKQPGHTHTLLSNRPCPLLRNNFRQRCIPKDHLYKWRCNSRRRRGSAGRDRNPHFQRKHEFRWADPGDRTGDHECSGWRRWPGEWRGFDCQHQQPHCPLFGQLATLGSPILNWSGGGSNFIQYNSCWANFGDSIQYQLIASREEMC
jgi:hypothetical protein